MLCVPSEHSVRKSLCSGSAKQAEDQRWERERKPKNALTNKHFRDPVVTGLPPLLRGLPSISEDALLEVVRFSFAGWRMEEKEMRGEVERRKENQGSQGARMITVLPVALSWALSQPAVFLVQEGIPVHSSGNAAARFHGCSRACVDIPNKDPSSLLHSADLCCVASMSFC